MPLELAQAPATIPHGPAGEYPEDWVKCGDGHRPENQVYPHELDMRAIAPTAPNPLVGTKWFVDRMEPAYGQWRKWKRAGQTGKADTIWRLAREPRFRWFGALHQPAHAEEGARLPQPRAVRPARLRPDDGRHAPPGAGVRPDYLAGGRAEDRRTMKWYDQFAAAVGDARVVIAFEPDSLGTIDCLARSRRDDRLRMLRHGVDVLSQLPNATIYLEAGASDWEPATAPPSS